MCGRQYKIDQNTVHIDRLPKYPLCQMQSKIVGDARVKYGST